LNKINRVNIFTHNSFSKNLKNNKENSENMLLT
jgi:hypothetical protein